MNEQDELLAQMLAEADEHVTGAQARIASLRAQIAEFEREGYDASAPRGVLETLEADLELMQRHRGVIARLLEVLGGPTTGRRRRDAPPVE